MATRVSVSRKTAVAAHKKRRRRRRRGKMTLHYIFLLFFLLAAGITLSLTVFFEVESISVIGTDKYTQEEIIATSGLQVGENLFRTDLAAAKESVQKA